MARFQRTGSSRWSPSALRSSGMSTMPWRRASAGLRIRSGSAFAEHRRRYPGRSRTSRSAVLFVPDLQGRPSRGFHLFGAAATTGDGQGGAGRLGARAPSAASLGEGFSGNIVLTSLPAMRLTASARADRVHGGTTDGAAVAQDGHGVGQRPHLAHPVRDQDHGRARGSAAHVPGRTVGRPRHSPTMRWPRRGPGSSVGPWWPWRSLSSVACRGGARPPALWGRCR